MREAFRWEVPPSFNFGPDVIDHLASRDRLGLIYIDRYGYRRDYRFSEIAQLSQRYAGALRDLGVRPGERAIVVLPLSAKALFVLLALDRIGAVAVPCDPAISGDELALRAYETRAAAAILHREGGEAVLRLQELRAGLRSILTVGGQFDGCERLDTRAEHALPYRGAITQSSEEAFVVYKPGGDAIVHARAYLSAAWFQAQYYLDARESDIVWPASRRANLDTGWNAFWGIWARGAAAVAHEGPFQPAERLDLVHELGVTILAQEPDAYRSALGLARFDSFRLDRVRRFVASGGRLDAPLARAWHHATGRPLANLYGTTETSALAGDLPGEPLSPGTIGRPAPGHDVAVIDEEGRRCAAGVAGELALLGRPPTRFLRSLDEAKEPEEWFRTGDAATVDEAGYLRLLA